MNLQWVKNARMKRQWPNKVVVSIQEQVPVARLNGNLFVNSEGEVFEHAYAMEPEKLPVLNGAVTRAGELLAQFAKLQTILEVGNIQLAELSVDERNTWTAETSEGIFLYLGSRDIESRLKRFLSVMKSDRAPEWGKISSIDLRHSNGFAIGWQTKQPRQSG
jgi:cell division protein FtsQ